MKLATLRTATGTRAAALRDDGWVLLPFGDVGELLRADDWQSVTEAARQSTRSTGAVEAIVPAESADFAAVVTTPAKVICCGLNYADHILEMGRDLPEFPTLFAKYADTLTGAYDDLQVTDSDSIDWEAELAVVVGAPLSDVDVEQARDGIAGYTVSNDVSMRDWQSRTLQWFQGKNFHATTPVGPWLVTPDEFSPVSDKAPTFAVEGWLGAEPMQHGDTSALVFPPAELLSYISRFTPLAPGDLILTGTPGGVGSGMTPPRFAGDGDVIRTVISGLGELANTVRVTSAR